MHKQVLSLHVDTKALGEEHLKDTYLVGIQKAALLVL